MKCPKCYTDMKQIEFEGVEVDRCYNCYGIWFDFQEQQRLKAKQGAVKKIDRGDPEVGQRTNLFDKINCPRDGAPMTHLVDLKQPHIGYEACPHCYGVFFDAGEFKDYSRKTLLESIQDLFPQERK